MSRLDLKKSSVEEMNQFGVSREQLHGNLTDLSELLSERDADNKKTMAMFKNMMLPTKKVIS